MVRAHDVKEATSAPPIWVSFGAVRWWAITLVVLSACKGPALETCDEEERLFGRPTADTGLTDAECAPSCASCDWTAPSLTRSTFDGWAALELATPYAEVTEDPYEAAAPTIPADAVCGVHVDGATYRLVDYATPDAAADADAIITHRGVCGVCSTLDDLAVYAGVGDLTKPVRQCGLDHIFGTQEEHLACLMNLGFTRPCAQIWYFNTKHTQAECADECFSAIDDPYHLDDGALNPCLRCDEQLSGPVFKAIAGRTRRNSGLATALCRPCDSVTPLAHDYLERSTR